MSVPEQCVARPPRSNECRVLRIKDTSFELSPVTERRVAKSRCAHPNWSISACVQRIGGVFVGNRVIVGVVSSQSFTVKWRGRFADDSPTSIEYVPGIVTKDPFEKI